ncbi:MAG: hypothetical protein FWE08_02560 [Oscillospiraceae bacterium]|nr:hypothetical protein [Oscillospiraceae bacterium]
MATDYKKMYFTLFNAMTDAINILQEAQLKTEEMYEGDDAPKLVVLPVAESGE